MVPFFAEFLAMKMSFVFRKNKNAEGCTLYLEALRQNFAKPNKIHHVSRSVLSRLPIHHELNFRSGTTLIQPSSWLQTYIWSSPRKPKSQAPK